MKTYQPKVPESLNPLARELLESLKGHPEAQAIVLGGGVALQHYLDYRKTVDLAAWWHEDICPEAEGLIGRVMQSLAGKHGLTFARRDFSHSHTQSYELKKEKTKVFSFQIAPRDVELDAPLPSAWDPVRIETFRDNLGSKMSALVVRGAPRDFLDVYTLCQRGLATTQECWDTWKRKNPALDSAQARVVVLEHLAALEGRRPLAALSDGSERQAAEALRNWVKRVLCRESS